MKELTFEIKLPEEVETIYKEDISLIKDGERFSFDEILPLGVSIGLSGHSLLIDFSSGFFQKYPLYDDTLFVRFTTGFQLNETELEGLITLGNDQTRYRSDFSFSSFLMLLFNLLLGVGCWFWNRGLRGTPQEKKATTLYYHLPRGVTPSEAGVLVDYEINGKDLGCLIYQWAIQKLIEITPDPSNRKSFIIKKLKGISKGVPEYEKVLFKGMFSLNNDGIFSLAFSKHRISPFFTKASRKLRESIDQKERFRKPFKELESLKALPLRIRKYWRIFLIILIMLLEP